MRILCEIRLSVHQSVRSNSLPFIQKWFLNEKQIRRKEVPSIVLCTRAIRSRRRQTLINLRTIEVPSEPTGATLLRALMEATGAFLLLAATVVTGVNQLPVVMEATPLPVAMVATETTPLPVAMATTVLPGATAATLLVIRTVPLLCSTNTSSRSTRRNRRSRKILTGRITTLNNSSSSHTNGCPRPLNLRATKHLERQSRRLLALFPWEPK